MLLQAVILTGSMEQCRPLAAGSSSTNQQIHCILWDPEFHYFIHQQPPPVPIPSQIIPMHAPLHPPPTQVGSKLRHNKHYALRLYISELPLKFLINLAI